MAASKAIDVKFYSYNGDGFLKWEMEHFNHNGVEGALGLLTRIDYPTYNLQGSPKIQNVDLDCDRILDFQNAYNYDNQNRLTEVYANYDLSGTGGHLIATYDYDPNKGVVVQKKYFAGQEGENGGPDCTNEEVDVISYDYDKRHRLTTKTSNFFSWTLFYDDDDFASLHPDGITHNFNGNINSSFASYNVQGNNIENPTEFFGSTAIYNYTYDNLNRLTFADAAFPDYPMFPQWNGSYPIEMEFFGNAEFVYDKIGNMDLISRWEINKWTGQIFESAFSFSYPSNNNRMSQVIASSQYSSGTWGYGYDGSGNLVSDERKQIAGIEYGRAHLPWLISNPNFGGAANLYEYNVNDERIYKTEGDRRGVNYEFYLRDATGKEIAIIDFATTEVVWYLHGNERVAKVEHQIDKNGRTDVPDGCSQISDKTKCTKFQGTVNPDFARLEDVNLSDIENQRRLQSLQDIVGTDQASGEPIFLFPDTLYKVKIAGNVRFTLEAGLSNLPPGIEIENQIPLDHPRQLIPFTNNESETIVMPLVLALGFDIDRPPVDPNPAPEGGDPFGSWLPPLNPNPPPPHASYYIYDHLGNTRVVYTPNLSCGGVIGNGNVGVTYHLNSVVDYFPYGKVSREYIDGQFPDRFLTTYHERDHGTGLDYRGARFYDSDIGRFLSLDPLAADFAGWSPYNYVLGNPVIFVDPTGLAPEQADDHYVDEDGNYLGQDGSDDKTVRVVSASTWDAVGGASGAKTAGGTALLQSSLFSIPLAGTGESSPGYQKGISISDDTWDEIAAAGGEVSEPFLTNYDNVDVAAKPEGSVFPGGPGSTIRDQTPFLVKPGEDVYGMVDAVKTSAYSNATYKVGTGDRIVVHPGGGVNVKSGIISKAYGAVTGKQGWGDRSGQYAYKQLHNTSVGSSSRSFSPAKVSPTKGPWNYLR